MAEKLNLKVGDKVRLIGPKWESHGFGRAGDVVTVTSFEGRQAWAGEPWGALTNIVGGVYEDFPIEKVEDAPIPLLEELPYEVRDSCGTVLGRTRTPSDALLLADRSGVRPVYDLRIPEKSIPADAEYIAFLDSYHDYEDRPPRVVFVRDGHPGNKVWTNGQTRYEESDLLKIIGDSEIVVLEARGA